MRFRRYEPKDFGQIIEICNADSRNEVVNEHEYRVFLNRQDKEHYVIEMHEKVVALVSISEIQHGEEQGLYFYCQIDPQYYGSGIGHRVYHDMLNQWRSDAQEGRRQIGFVQACCDAKRKEMLDFFLSIGGQIVHYYQTMYMDIEHCKLQPQFALDYRVTCFTEADLEEYYELEKQIFAGHFTYNPKTLEDLRKLVSMPDVQWDGFFLLWKGNDMIGFCRTLYHAENFSCTVTHLGIRQEYRRRGLGRNLLLHALENVQQKGATCVVLAVEGTNEFAFNLYWRLGFLTRSKRLIIEKRLDTELVQQELSLEVSRQG